MAFVVAQVKTWHEGHPNAMSEKDGAREAWKNLIKTMGSFAQQLKSIELSRGDHMKISETYDGILFEL